MSTTPESPPPTEPGLPTSSAKPVPWTRLLLPVVAFVTMLIWSNIPPYREHILHEKRGYFVWHWRLFWQGGAKVCDLRYFDMNQGGAPIERWTLLGYERPGDMPDEIARIHYNKLKTDHERVCDALRKSGDAQPNVQVAVRCGFDYGWKQITKRKRNICATAKAKPKAKPKPAQGGK